MLYKMDLLCIDERLFSVVNIRMNLDHHTPTSRQRKTMRRVESRFTVTYGHAQPDANKKHFTLSTSPVSRDSFTTR